MLEPFDIVTQIFERIFENFGLFRFKLQFYLFALLFKLFEFVKNRILRFAVHQKLHKVFARFLIACKQFFKTRHVAVFQFSLQYLV
ncbi:MAG: hypothetical protein DBY28_04550 [Subdoligranulum sp.]|nr:MAG: hypothetical protein DBY28_04550 [Subdoligranulum sp.]